MYRILKRDFTVVRTVKEAADRHYTFIVCAFKCILDVHSTSSILAPLLDTLPSSPDTAIVLLQNGIGIEDELLGALASRHLDNVVISGCAWVDVTLVEGGKKIIQHGNERLVLGFHKPRDSVAFSEIKAQASVDAFCALLHAGGATAEADDIDFARWRKVLW